MNDSAGSIDWFSWEEGLASARERDAPVLLFLSATWCTECSEMEETVFENPQIRANLAEFVPVKVDADRRPRVRDRYNMGGFPSTVFCTPDGKILTGATALGVEGLRSVLERVRGVWTDRENPGRVPRPLRETEPPVGTLDAGIESHFAGQLDASVDEQYGGWGDAPKFPLPRTVEFALKRDRQSARRTLEAIRTHLHDDYEGGFFRYAANRDWSDISHEKLADENAALLRAFANAYLATGEDGYRETAGRTVEYLTTTLWTGEAVAASQAPGPDDSYGAPEDRTDPPVDQTVYAGSNALAVDALLTYYAYTDDAETKRFAERTLSTLDELVDDGGCVTHCADGDHTVLSDQARVLRALTTAREVLGDEGALATARAVADHTIEELQVEDGRFQDGRSEGAGLLSYPLFPIDTTAELADGLLDLAVLTGEERYREAARDALAAYAGASDRLGPELASYGTAVSRLVDEPLVIRVGEPAGSDLHRAALRIADHEAVIVPGADCEGALASVDGRRAEPADSPAELEGAVTALFGVE